MGLKSTGLSGSYGGSQVAPYQIVDCGGPIARSGEGQPAGWHGLQAGRAGAYGRRPSLGTSPRASPPAREARAPPVFFGCSAANGARGRTDNANCGDRLVGVPFGPMTKPHGSCRGRLRPARRECGPAAGGRLARRQEGGGSESTNTEKNHRIHWHFCQDAPGTPTIPPTRDRRPRPGPLSPGGVRAEQVTPEQNARRLPRDRRPNLDYSWRSENGQWECPRGAENGSRQGRGRPVDGFGPCGRRISA